MIKNLTGTLKSVKSHGSVFRKRIMFGVSNRIRRRSTGRTVPGRLWTRRSRDEPVVRPNIRRRDPLLADQTASINETADDAVVLRVIAGLIGLLMLLGYLAVRRRANSPSVLPAGLVDALGAAAFAAGTAGLALAAADQAVHNGTSGVGFPLSGVLVALPATVYFCVRAARDLLPSR